MGFWPWSNQNNSPNQNNNSESFHSFTSKLIKIVCKTDEDGQYRCEKTIQSSDPNESNQVDQPDIERYKEAEEEIQKIYNIFGSHFNRHFSFIQKGIFDRIEEEEYKLLNEIPFQRRGPNSRESQFRTKEKSKEQDSNIYDI